MAEPLPVRLNGAVSRLLGRPVASGDRFGIAVSGGADSMALLALAAALWPGQVEGATVDHGLRPEAGDEAAMVAQWCLDKGVSHIVLRPHTAIRGNLQSQARQVRYALLEDWRVQCRIDWLMTAHQADDQIETLMLRLNRGSGVSGLASVRGRRGPILRPMLGMRRAELRDYCTQQGVPFVDDPSNEDPHFDRVRMRQALNGVDLFDPDGLARSMDALNDAAMALDWMADRLEAAHVAPMQDGLALEKTDLPRELLRRLLLRMIARVYPQSTPPRGPSLDQALVQLFDGKTVALADCVLSGGDRWVVRKAPPRRMG